MSEQPDRDFGEVGRRRGLPPVGRIGLIVVLVTALVLLLRWPRAAPVATGTVSVFTFACCPAEDLTKAVYPGESLTLHWIVKPASKLGTSDPVTLEARVFGPFADVASLKAAFSDVATPNVSVAQYAAPLIATRTTDGRAQISAIPLPVAAAPGYYDLETTVTSGGAVLGGGSIFQVKARG